MSTPPHSSHPDLQVDSDRPECLQGGTKPTIILNELVEFQQVIMSDRLAAVNLSQLIWECPRLERDATSDQQVDCPRLGRLHDRHRTEGAPECIGARIVIIADTDADISRSQLDVTTVTATCPDRCHVGSSLFTVLISLGLSRFPSTIHRLTPSRFMPQGLCRL